MSFEWKEGVQKVLVKGEVYGPLGIRASHDNLWRVTHLDSGFCAGRFATRAESVQYVEKIAGLDGWAHIRIGADGTVEHMPEGHADSCIKACQELEIQFARN